MNILIHEYIKGSVIHTVSSSMMVMDNQDDVSTLTEEQIVHGKRKNTDEEPKDPNINRSPSPRPKFRKEYDESDSYYSRRYDRHHTSRHYPTHPVSTAQRTFKSGYHHRDTQAHTFDKSPPPTLDELIQQSNSLLTLKEFLETMDSAFLGEERAISAYTEYKNKFLQVHLDKFFQLHKSEEWFLEKYDSEYGQSYYQEWTKYAMERKALFISSLQSGTLDTFHLDEEPSDSSIQDTEHSSAISHSSIEIINRITPTLPTLIIKSIPVHIKRSSLIDIFSKFPGFLGINQSDPNPHKQFQRLGWILFEQGTDLSSYESQFGNIICDGFPLSIDVYKNPNMNRIRWAYEEYSHPDRIILDLEQVKKLVSWADSHRQLDDVDITSMIQGDNKKELDILVLYLRIVHLICYYCASSVNCIEELHKECGQIHARHIKEESNPASASFHQSMIKRNDEKMINNWIQYPPLISLDRCSKELDREVTLKDIEEELLRSYIVPVEPNDPKSRCQLCNKLFKGSEFVLKHLNLKHDQEIIKLKDSLFLKKIFLRYKDDWIQYLSSQVSNRPSIVQTQLHRHQSEKMHPYSRPPVQRMRPNREPISNRPIRSYSDLDAPSETRSIQELDYGN